jgi:hypothetical protein
VHTEGFKERLAITRRGSRVHPLAPTTQSKAIIVRCGAVNRQSPASYLILWLQRLPPQQRESRQRELARYGRPPVDDSCWAAIATSVPTGPPGWSMVGWCDGRRTYCMRADSRVLQIVRQLRCSGARSLHQFAEAEHRRRAQRAAETWYLTLGTTRTPVRAIPESLMVLADAEPRHGKNSRARRIAGTLDRPGP